MDHSTDTCVCTGGKFSIGGFKPGTRIPIKHSLDIMYDITGRTKSLVYHVNDIPHILVSCSRNFPDSHLWSLGRHKINS